jgi:hypothetical protein
MEGIHKNRNRPSLAHAERLLLDPSAAVHLRPNMISVAHGPMSAQQWTTW